MIRIVLVAILIGVLGVLTSYALHGRPRDTIGVEFHGIPERMNPAARRAASWW
jgi:hypothetical protein